MLKWLQSAFKRKPLIEITESPWEDTTFKILHELKYNRSPLTLLIPGDTQAYASFILEIDPQKKQFILDELFPQEGNHLARPGLMVTLRGRNKGVHVNFECAVERTINRHGLKGLKVRFPEDLNYMQRRESFRVSPPHSHRLECQFRVPNVPNFTGEVADISLTGMRLIVQDNIVPFLKPHMEIIHSDILLPNQEMIHNHFKLCHIAYSPEDSVTIIGCEFKNLTAEAQRKINQCVTDIQRLKSQQEQTKPDKLS